MICSPFNSRHGSAIAETLRRATKENNYQVCMITSFTLTEQYRCPLELLYKGTLAGLLLILVLYRFVPFLLVVAKKYFRLM